MAQALLLIDVQNDYFPGGAYALAGIEAASVKAAALLAHFRDAGLPLFHVRTSSEARMLRSFVPARGGPTSMRRLLRGLARS
jgi:nicotinamidase-related amidase